MKAFSYKHKKIQVLFKATQTQTCYFLSVCSTIFILKIKNSLKGIIGTLEAIKTTQDETIQDLEEQLEESKAEQKKIEELYGKLKNERQNNEDVNMRQLQQLAVV